MCATCFELPSNIVSAVHCTMVSAVSKPRICDDGFLPAELTPRKDILSSLLSTRKLFHLVQIWSIADEFTRFHIQIFWTEDAADLRKIGSRFLFLHVRTYLELPSNKSTLSL